MNAAAGDTDESEADTPGGIVGLRVGLARLEERISSHMRETHRGFDQVATDVKLARTSYPTSEDIAKTARDQADRAYERAAREAKEGLGRVETAAKGLETKVELAAENALKEAKAVESAFKEELRSAVEALGKRIDVVAGRQSITQGLGATGIVIGIASSLFYLLAGG